MKSGILSGQSPFVALVLLALGLGGVSNTAVAETPVLNETQKLLASDKTDHDLFGYAVSLDANTALISTYADIYSQSNPNFGAAYVFMRIGDAWSEQAKLLDSETAGGDRFGQAVAVDGDTAIVGAWNDYHQYGKAYVFTRVGDTWTEQAKLVASDKSPGDRLGWSIALDGDTAVIGAMRSDDDGKDDNGAAYVFTRVGDTWTEQAKLLASNKADYDNFGWSVALDGDTAVIGAWAKNNRGRKNVGAAYVFTRVGDTWTEQDRLLASDKARNDHFGWSVAVDGDTAFIGATGSDDDGKEDNGAAYVFTRVGDTWTEQVKLLASDKTNIYHFGSSVALDGDTTVIAARYSDDSGTINNGAAYVFTRDGDTWTEQMKLLASDGADGVGYAVALDGDSAIVSAPGSDDSGTINNGAAYVFDLGRSTDAVEIGIDIKPFDNRNQLDPSSPMLFSVGILSDDDFDALQTDLQTIVLEPGDARARNYRVYDANRDRIPDLVPLFRARDLRIGCGETEVELTGKTHDGVEFHGTDVVRNRRCPR